MKSIPFILRDHREQLWRHWADALVLDEMPAFADALDQLKAANAFLDRLVCATMAAA